MLNVSDKWSLPRSKMPKIMHDNAEVAALYVQWENDP